MATGQKGKPKLVGKLCIRCSKVLPLGDFFPNRKWESQQYHDAWCKSCAYKYTKDLDGVRLYCKDNNRGWDDSYWDSCIKKARYQLATDPAYVKALPEKRAELEVPVAAKHWFSIMNLNQFYVYEEHGVVMEVGEEELGDVPDPSTQSEVKYSKEWRGYYTDDQIEALNDIYRQYDEDFVLDNVSIRDYARKVAKASLNLDMAEDRMRRGNGDSSEYKEMQRIFDDLSKSANFAACRRKPGENSGLGSLGEIIMRIETSGALETQGVTFPEDDVDRIIKDFRHTLTAVGIAEEGES